MDSFDVQFMCSCSTPPPRWTVLPFPTPHPLFLKKSGIHFSILFLSSSNPMEKVIPSSFSVGSLHLVLGASMRSSPRGKGHEEGSSAYTKAGLSLRNPPGYSRASTPKNQSLPTLLLCALTSDFTGVAHHHHLTLSKKN